MQWVSRLLISSCCLAGLSGCNLFGWTITRQEEIIEPRLTPDHAAIEEPSPKVPAECGGKLSREQRMYLELVQKMVDQGQYYAAMSHLDQLEKTADPTPQTVYLRAESLRGAGKSDEAEIKYRSLLDGCMAGYGLHGLGLLSAASGQLAQAEEFLSRAVRERPVDAGMHNDLGMVFMMSGQDENARQQFLTASQLDKNNPLPEENLIVLMLLEKQDAEARQLAKQRRLDRKTMERLEQQASRLERSRINHGKTEPQPSSPKE